MVKVEEISRKKLLIGSLIILTIFFIGFSLRFDTIQLHNIPSDEKPSYLDENGLPYMYELDSYYNYRLTQNYLDHGYLGDTRIDGREWDEHSYYPPGVPLDYPPLIVYLTAFIYKLVNLFGQVPLLVVCFWLSAFIGPLAGIVTYFFVRRYSNEYGAVAAGILMALAPIYFIRTVPGWFDTDMFNLIFPILTVWIFMEAVQKKEFKRRILLATLAAFSMFLFATAWNGWQYYFYLIVVYGVLFGLWCVFRRREVKEYFYVLLTFSVITLLLVGFFTGFLNIIKLVLGPGELIKISGASHIWAPWPDLYSTISELARPSIEKTITYVGFSFFAGVFGFIWILRILINKKQKNQYLSNITPFFYIFLLLWSVTGFVSLTKGVRFMIILIPPLVISTGILIGICTDYLKLLKNSERFKIFQRQHVITFMSILIVVLATIPAMISVYNSFTFEPGVDDNSWDASVWVKNNTSNDTVIISEWSYGHLLTAIADRPVLLDGRSAYIETVPVRKYDSAFPHGIKSPGVARDYWIQRGFSTDNNNLSFGIFRMLSTSGDMAYITLGEYTKNTTQTVNILNQILGVNKDDARSILIQNYNLSQEQSDNVTQYTHPEKSSPFVIFTYIDMVNKGYWIFNTGNWDFNEEKGGNFTYDHGEIATNGKIDDDSLKVDPETINVTFDGKTPYCVIKVINGSVEKTYLDENSDLCVYLLNDNKKWVVIEKRFENSLFAKLVLEKTDTDHFKKIYENKKVGVWEPIS